MYDLIDCLNQLNSIMPIEEYCMLSDGTCIQNEVVMTLNKDIIQPLVPFKMTVRWKNSHPKGLLLSMRGLEMDMGVIKYRLQSIGNKIYDTDIVFPICTANKMTWIGTLSDGIDTVYPAIRILK
ncbi:hypothetical protein [Candidatus Photodesmus blepharus]|uniref:hypothetical protein n=1 Tax=Candidatus Photodesmus blepharonis TaxID=1179155 RepID=UPI0012DF0DE6|nr:hypothetical protein [Candidatus Photodesmus blepharus]